MENQIISPKGHDTRLLDLRGFGISYKPEAVSDYAAGKIVGDLLALLDLLGAPEVHVVGHDWGAAAAYALSFTRDPRIKSLTILNGVHPIPFQDQLAAGGAQTEASQYMNWLREPGSEEVLAANGFEKLVGFFAENMDMEWLSGPRLEEYKAAWSGETTLRSMVNWYRATPLIVPKPGEVVPMDDRIPMPRDAMRVVVPHLVIWGTGDTALLPETRDGVRELADDLRMVEIADADHWLHHQKPALVARHIKEFLAPLA